MEGLSAVWSAAYQPDRTLKTKFLAALLKPLDDGCCLASGGAAKVRHSYRYCIAVFEDETMGGWVVVQRTMSP